MFLIVALIAAIFFFMRGSGGLGFSIGSSQATSVPPPQGTIIAPQASNAQTEATAISGVSKVLNAVPVVGTVLGSAFNAISGNLLAASEQRRKLAINENSAVAAAVPGWDQAMTQIQLAYNNGTITATQAQQLVDAAWSNYWNEVSPVIQPGRNGCQSGSVTQIPSNTCAGSWGAACCVGYANLLKGGQSIKAAIAATENSGKQAIASIPQVFASKYGGINRPGYTLTFIRPSSLFGL